jgi:hypothetical protein
MQGAEPDSAVLHIKEMRCNMKILILKMQQNKSGIMFLPSFVGPEEEVVINLPQWANKIVITKNEDAEAKMYAIYANKKDAARLPARDWV